MLTVSQLHKSFDAVPVLTDISVSFKPGTVTGLIGDNGAGKSTFLKTLAGIYQPDSGHIDLDGRRLDHASPLSHRDAGIGMVYQDFFLAREQEVVANLFMGREICHRWTRRLDEKEMTARAQDALNRLGIHIPDLKRPVKYLSGGQQQCIAIARAVMFDTRVLLLDEPTAALAAREVHQVLDLIRQQRAQGRIVVLVSHRLNDVLDATDRIVVMKQGQISQDVARQGLSLQDLVEMIVS